MCRLNFVIDDFWIRDIGDDPPIRHLFPVHLLVTTKTMSALVSIDILVSFHT